MNIKRITLFAGHYGSGKTNIAVNYAKYVKNSGKDCVLADIDIVNPYYRAKDSAGELETMGIHVISSVFANSNVDVPALPGEVYSVIDNKEKCAIIDVGGDDRGALALGRYVPSIIEENNYDMLFVLNARRPLTCDIRGALDAMNEISLACRLPFTGIINNTNIGNETTADTVLSSVEFANELSKITGLEIKMTTVVSSLVPELKGKVDNLFPLELQNFRKWQATPEV